MDPSAMDFVMHQPDQAGSVPLPTMDPRGSRSRCPAFRMAEHHHHQPMPSFRANYQFDPVHNSHHFWQPLPPPHNRWIPDPAYQPSPPMPPNSGQIGQPPYPPSSGPNNYNAHPTPPYDYRAPMLSLQRIGGTAPIQHSQGNFSVPGSQGGHGGQGGQGIQAQPQVAGQGSGAGGFNSNGTLPPLNPMASSAQTRPLSFNQTSRPAQAQQSGRHSPPPFRQNSTPSTNLPVPEVPTSSRLNEAENTHSASPSPHRSAAADPAGEETTSGPRRTSANRNRRGFPRLPSSDSGWSSDDDSDRDAVAMSLLEEVVSAAPVSDDRLRAHQIMRGAVSNKRVASKKALTSLESVAISDLPKAERTCVICYNDYGVETPEGISEIPLRLPKCKHVFGDHCIKKWFEESDSCPYCRDKVPSEPQYRQVMTAHNMYRFLRQHQLRNVMERERGGPDSASRANGSPYEAYAALASGPFADFEYGGLGNPAYRRADGSSGYSSRNAAWHGNTAERHSPLPFTEISSENRRRARSHRGSLRYPPGRPHFPTPPAGSASQSQQYPWLPPTRQLQSHPHRPSSSTSGIRNVDHALTLQAQFGVSPEPYLNPLNMGNSGGTLDDYHNLSHMRPQHASPLSPTYAGPEVYMSNADDHVFGGTGTHSSM
ncbi:hypothetical protein F4818DRAFT_44558 [Hypoxylon cercidicola]|nr:hypothetical protein F4818DRAFT_44558 [Hypoxylon cercidicola]